MRDDLQKHFNTAKSGEISLTHGREKDQWIGRLHTLGRDPNWKDVIGKSKSPEDLINMVGQFQDMQRAEWAARTGFNIEDRPPALEQIWRNLKGPAADVYRGGAEGAKKAWMSPLLAPLGAASGALKTPLEGIKASWGGNQPGRGWKNPWPFGIKVPSHYRGALTNIDGKFFDPVEYYKNKGSMDDITAQAAAAGAHWAQEVVAKRQGSAVAKRRGTPLPFYDNPEAQAAAREKAFEKIDRNINRVGKTPNPTYPEWVPKWVPSTRKVKKFFTDLMPSSEEKEGEEMNDKGASIAFGMSWQAAHKLAAAPMQAPNLGGEPDNPTRGEIFRHKAELENHRAKMEDMRMQQQLIGTKMEQSAASASQAAQASQVKSQENAQAVGQAPQPPAGLPQIPQNQPPVTPVTPQTQTSATPQTTPQGAQSNTSMPDAHWNT
jgi:hypothetical protein